MKTAAELKHGILTITTKINKDFPELSKHLKTLPETVSGKNKGSVSIKNLKEYHHFLVDLIEKNPKPHDDLTGKNEMKKIASPGYPLYAPSDDIYNRGKKEMDIDPNDISKNKTPNEDEGSMNEKDFDGNMSGDDLDVPGSELDNSLESVGSEDEENNYYSLGSDNHSNLDEDKG